MKKLVLCFAIACILTLAQPAANHYSATTGDVVLSGAGTKFTVQQPATRANTVQFDAAVIYCSVACDVTQLQNGSAATSTAGTVNGLLPTVPNGTATVWTASNVGAGTLAGGILHLAAGERVTLDLRALSMASSGTGNNYTVAISSITGTANITVFWREQ